MGACKVYLVLYNTELRRFGFWGTRSPPILNTSQRAANSNRGDSPLLHIAHDSSSHSCLCLFTRSEMRIRPAGHAGGEDTTYTNSLCPRKAQASRGRLVTHDLNVRERAFSSHWRHRSMSCHFVWKQFSPRNGFTDILSLHQSHVYISIKRAQQTPKYSLLSPQPLSLQEHCEVWGKEGFVNVCMEKI